MIHFTHQLTRMRFEAYAAEEKAKGMTITGIDVISKYKGTMTVASRTREGVGIRFDNERKPLALCEAWDGISDKVPSLRQDYYKLDSIWDEAEKDKEWYDRKKMDVGSCLLLAPDSVLTVYVHYKVPVPTKKNQSEDSYEMKSGTLMATITAPQNALSQCEDGKYWFAPGVEYTIKIAMYGPQDIRLFTSIEGWRKSNNDILINDDEKDY